MLSLFQASGNVKRHFWIILLVFLIFIGKPDNPLLKFKINPIEAFIQALVFYGFVILVSTAILVILSIILFAVREIMISRSSGLKKFLIVTRDNNWLIGILADFTVIIATLVSFSKFGSTDIQKVGTLGLFFILLIEVIDFSKIYTADFLELRINGNKTINATIFEGSKKSEFYFEETIHTIIGHLEKWDWDKIESKDSGKIRILTFKK